MNARLCCTYNPESIKNLQIEKTLRQSKSSSENTIQVLLLGSSESGKTTIFKQLRMYYGRYFSQSEKIFFSNIIVSNMHKVLKSLVKICEIHSLPLSWDFPPELLVALNSLQPVPSDQKSGPRDLFFSLQLSKQRRKEIGEVLTHLISSNSDSFQSVFSLTHQEAPCNLTRVTELNRAPPDPSKTPETAHKQICEDVCFHLPDNAEYFLSSCSRVFSEDFSPSLQDILNTRLSTTGVEKVTVREDNIELGIVDVGGQRGERKKWMRVFENEIDVVVYVASLAEFDQSDPEEKERSRILASIELFDEVINSYFSQLPVILLLNKKDVFKRKIEKKGFGKFFEIDNDDMSVQEAADYIRAMYVEKREGEGALYVYDMEAINTEVFGIVWKVVKGILFEKNLVKSGLLNN